MTLQDESKASQQAQVCLRSLDDGGGHGPRPLDQLVTILGSGDDCEVNLPPNKADIAHAAIVLLGNTAYLCDLGAPGGTTLNNRRIRWARLADGDELAVNTCRFRVELKEDPIGVTGEQPAFRLRDERSIGEVTTIDPVLIVGSDPGCDAVLHDDTVAARQALVIWTQDGPMLRDLHGRGGIRLNAKPIKSAYLIDGDQIAIGPYEMTFEIDAVSAETRRASPVGAQDGSRSQARDTLLYRGDESSAFGLISGRIASSQASDVEFLWPERTTPPPDHSNIAPAARLNDQAGDTTDMPDLTADESDLDDDMPEAEAPALPAASGAPAEAALDRPETNDEGNATVETNFAMEDEHMESAELIQDTSSTAHANQTDGEMTTSTDQLSDDRVVRMRSRVAAAQQALDQRARKQLEQLNDERMRLRAYEAELQQRASDLLNAAREHRRQRERERLTAEAEAARAKASEDLTQLGRLAGEMQTIEASTTTASPTVDNEENGVLRDSLMEMGRRTLQERAAELANLVRSEQDEIDRAESQFASLRVGIRRMREFVDRTESRHRLQEAELESLLNTLRQEDASQAKERERLMASLRELDDRSARVRAKIDAAGHDRDDLDREAEQLAEVQKKLVEKEEALRAGLEMERQRIQVRQTELQRRATELARAARDKRCSIEAEISRRRAALDLQEAELRANRAAVEEAGRTELEKAATELERVLNVRLANNEAAMSGPRENITPNAPAPAPINRIPDTPTTAKTDQPVRPAADETPPEAVVLAGMLREVVEGRGKRLTALQEELAALRSAMTKLGRQDNEPEGILDNDIMTLRASAPGPRRDRRCSAMELRGSLDKNHATLRGAEGMSDDRAAAGSEVTAAASAPGGPHGGEGRSDGR